MIVTQLKFGIIALLDLINRKTENFTILVGPMSFFLYNLVPLIINIIQFEFLVFFFFSFFLIFYTLIYF
jgi:hypothetical protein